jgi:hypothetical protein
MLSSDSQVWLTAASSTAAGFHRNAAPQFLVVEI